MYIYNIYLCMYVCMNVCIYSEFSCHLSAALFNFVLVYRERLGCMRPV